MKTLSAWHDMESDVINVRSDGELIYTTKRRGRVKSSLRTALQRVAKQHSLALHRTPYECGYTMYWAIVDTTP